MFTWSRSRRWAALLLLCAACGGGPRLTNLRCRESPCQDPEDPFMLRLAVDFSDPSGTMGAGALELLLNGNLVEGVSLADLFNAQSIALNATEGTLQVDEALSLSSVHSGETFSAGLRARNGQAQESNAPELDFTLSLGGN